MPSCMSQMSATHTHSNHTRAENGSLHSKSTNMLQKVSHQCLGNNKESGHSHWQDKGKTKSAQEYEIDIDLHWGGD